MPPQKNPVLESQATDSASHHAEKAVREAMEVVGGQTDETKREIARREGELANANKTAKQAHTEVVFDRDRDVWITVGNDDRSDIWINGLPVWHNSDRLKGWRVDEARRHVRFRKGTNEILYRLENGWYETVFSFCIHLGIPEPSMPVIKRKTRGRTE